MFNEISWQSYWITIAIIAAGYYIIICLFYFRRDFKQWTAQQPDGIKGLTSNDFSATDDRVEKLVSDCMDEVNAFFQQEKANNCVKHELIFSLQKILTKYSSLVAPDYKQLLGKSIAAQCEHICSVRLDEDDISSMWLDL